jgi:VWFA-related protein
MRVMLGRTSPELFMRDAPRLNFVLLIFAVVFLPKAALPAQAHHSARKQPAPQQQPSQALSPQPAFQQPQPPKIAVESKMITVYASVRDKKGQIISNLTKEDFAVDEDGRPQAITYFARENDLPLNVGLVVDTRLSQRRLLADERTASSTFIDHIMREEKKDQAFLIHFDREVELLQDLTTSRKKLQSALGLLQAPRQEEVSDNSGNAGRHRGGGTLYDAIFLASDELMGKQQGRKALIVLSDGVDRGSKESLQTSIEAAQRANTVVYSILFKDEGAYGDHGGSRPRVGWGGIGGPGGPGGQRRYPQQREQRTDGKKILDRVSKETGGRLFEVSKKQPVDQIYVQIEHELRDQYILGYVPDKPDTSGDYHKIHLTTKKQDLVVQARDGYYAQPGSGHGQ